MPSRPRPTQRGMSLIEVMIALAVLAVGLVAMWNLHVIGLTATAAGRRQTIATAIAADLVSGLERLAFSDPLVLESGPAGQTAPAPFGRLVDGSGAIASGAHVWDDANPVPGVRLTTEMRQTGEVAAEYERRWTVWAVSPPGGVAATKVIAVSVTWKDPPFGRPREVVQYGYVSNPVILGLALGSTP